MDTQTAKANIGKPFKWKLSVAWDEIVSVDDDGMIIGKFLEAPAEDCRLKQPVPEGFKKNREMDFDMVPGAPDVDANGNCYSDADPGL